MLLYMCKQLYVLSLRVKLLLLPAWDCTLIRLHVLVDSIGDTDSSGSRDVQVRRVVDVVRAVHVGIHSN